MPPERFGERIAALEQRYEFLMQHVESLATDIEEVKKQAAENSELVQKNARVWDDRWAFGKGVFWAVCALAGTLGTIGLVRLNEIFNLLSRVK